MKNIIIKLLIILYTLSFFNACIISNVNADGIKITVSEKVPGANCTLKEKKKETDPQLYECNVAKGFTPVTKMLGNMIKYFTYIAALGGVLYIIINGIMYSMGGIEESMKSGAKTRIIGTLTGLILLFLSGVILNIIAPWIYK